ncbi:MAG: hypothetical protein OXS40_10615 [Gammaproteobacteria bacterium]|nr:hypothetical protein [Gammaproteobacteria bacterium]
MIDIRLITRTHYQISEPAYLTLLIRKCTSPTSSNYRETVAQRFSKLSGGTNIAASGYAVDLARSLNLLNSNLVWTELGHLLNIAASNNVLQNINELSTAEKILFFRLFLEFDGAAFIFLAQKLETQAQLPLLCESWTDIAQQLFLETYEWYLELVTDPLLRTRIRQLQEKRRLVPFKGNSGRHQSLIHINTMFRLGLIDSFKSKKSRLYKPKYLEGKELSPTSNLLSAVPNIKTLEEVVESQSLYNVVGQTLGIECNAGSINDMEFMNRVKYVYSQVSGTGVNLCSLRTLSEALQIQSLIEKTVPESHTTILSRLRTLQNKTPSQIRFHVDRYGNPAYIKIEL